MKTEDHMEERLSRDPSLKENPFQVPEGYFDSLDGRLKEERERQDAAQVPVRKLVSMRRIALAAAVVGLALLSYPLSRLLGPGNQGNYMEELALMEGAGLYYNDYALATSLYEEEEMDDEEAFASLAEDYLAMGSRSMDLYLELE